MISKVFGYIKRAVFYAGLAVGVVLMVLNFKAVAPFVIATILLALLVDLFSTKKPVKKD